MSTVTKNHWETVYETKTPDQVSWTQEFPKTSLDFIRSFGLPKTAKIIDVGGGDSKLVDYLLEEGYENITVLDISANALQKAKQRLGKKSKPVTWIVSDITDFEADNSFDIWHDRATFHFLTSSTQINQYMDIARKATTGYLERVGKLNLAKSAIRQIMISTLVERLEMPKNVWKMTKLTKPV